MMGSILGFLYSGKFPHTPSVGTMVPDSTWVDAGFCASEAELSLGFLRSAFDIPKLMMILHVYPYTYRAHILVCVDVDSPSGETVNMNSSEDARNPFHFPVFFFHVVLRYWGGFPP